MLWLETDLQFPLGKRAALMSEQSPTEYMKGSLADYRQLQKTLARYHQKSEAKTIFPTGAAVGFITYEGNFEFGFYPELKICSAEHWPFSEESFYQTTHLTSSLEKTDYVEKVQKLQNYIEVGDIYQANLTRQITGRFEGSTRALFSQIKRFSPAPFSAYLELPSRTILSASPELFLRFSGRRVITCPIKGTRPRFRDAMADQQSAFDLIRSEKELAELIMITDLERNDLGKICDYGSVEVQELVAKRSFSHVHHLMSVIQGWLRPEISQVEALVSCFPGGSITGAPKKRAMEIIRELEGQPRGLYTGAIGYFGFNGESQFNIAIRTLEICDNTFSFGVGSGITIDSEPQKEFEETQHKAAGLLQALNYFSKLSVQRLKTEKLN
ncbi:MAG: aminodeoxychorismate synthase component I [Verrucomicrobiae bacterium]|nr:aminodeoxychorismate synthase component I [Verrucomicrobiae bacterium]